MIKRQMIMDNFRKAGTYPVRNCGGSGRVVIRFNEYEASSALAVALYSLPDDIQSAGEDLTDDDFSELYAVLTVNLPESESLARGTQFIDTNNHPWAYGWLIDNGLAEPAGIFGKSGFCVYPAMKFTLENADSPESCRSMEPPE